jgi:hypothetical protein
LSPDEKKSLTMTIKTVGTAIPCPVRVCKLGVDCPLVHRPNKFKDGPDMLTTTLKERKSRKSDRTRRLQRLANHADNIPKKEIVKKIVKLAKEEYSTDSEDDQGNDQTPEHSQGSSMGFQRPLPPESGPGKVGVGNTPY